ncbi:MAG TPA: 50S ribosomal protein L17 [Myxococcales bacterium]|jgi:large subunit ribosomal protein L17
MKHGVVGRKLNRSRPHFHALMDNLVASVLKHESIKTTLPKAKEVRPLVEKVITLAKKGTLHARRTAFKTVREEVVLHKLFAEIGPRMKERKGGYTRILRLGKRAKDAAPMALLELVDYKPKLKVKAAKAKKGEEAEETDEKAEVKAEEKK